MEADQILDIGITFASIEKKLGEIERSRAIYIYLSQFSDPNNKENIENFWKVWEEFELSHGNEDTYKDDLNQGMAIGPLTPEQAAEICQCTPQQLFHGDLAGKPERRYGDKRRTIHDATINIVNKSIQRHNTNKPPIRPYKTCSPAYTHSPAATSCY